MSTSARIAKREDDGTVRSVYCHFDGYPSYAGKLLRHHYTDPEIVDIVMNFGNFSALEQHVSDISFYITAPSPMDERAMRHASTGDFLEYGSKSASEYLYLFDQGRWRCWSTWNGSEILLSEETDKEPQF